MKLITTLFIIISFLISTRSISQTTLEIDSLLLKTHQQNHEEGNTKGALETAFEAVKLAEKINYERGIVDGYYVIAVSLADSENYEKSIEYVEKAKKFGTFLNLNKGSEFNLLLLQASNLYELGFSSLAAEFYQKAKTAVSKEKNHQKKQRNLMILYMKSYLAYPDIDSQYKFYLKAKTINAKIVSLPENLPKSEHLIKSAEINERIGAYHLEKNQLDSARYYYNTVLETGKELNSTLAQGLAFASLGMVSEKEGNYEEALILLNRSEELLKSNAIFSNLVIIYEMKQKIYRHLGNVEKEKEYLNLHKELMSKLQKQKDKGRNKTILNIVDEKEREIQQSETKFIIIITFVILGSIVTLVLGIVFFRSYRKRKQKLLVEKEQVIIEKQQETQSLQKRLNESFGEILEMAKENHPQFYNRFQEIYPNFNRSLLSINDKLTVSELTIAAYVYLGFTTKEIANNTYRSLKTVEATRYNLRKKLNLSSEINLQKWLSNILQ